MVPAQAPSKPSKGPNPLGGSGIVAWYNSFADLDPLANPDAIGKKEEEKERTENRYC